MSFKEDYIGSRRQFVLRLLVEVNGNANESVIYRGLIGGGFGATTKADLRHDLDYLAEIGAVDQEWLGALRVVTMTERGEDIAYGRVAAEGVLQSIWRRHG